MYRAIGEDGKEYGPVTADQIRDWIAQGRLGARSRIKPEDSTDWKTLAEMPEFNASFASVPSGQAGTPAPVAAKTSGMAITSLVLGVLGSCTVGLTALVGLVLGIIALVKINKSQGQLRGRGMAIAGTAVSGLMLMLLPIMVAMLLPALARAKSKAQSIQCMNQVKQLNLALMMYASDNKDTFPPADSWCDRIKPYVGNTTVVFRCPAQEGDRCSYSYNAAVANKKISEVGSPAQTVLVFSSADGWNQSGGRQLATAHKHGNRLTIGWADGHVEDVTASRAASMQW